MIIRFLKNTILCVAAVLLLLHNLTPHQHHGEMTAAEHQREHRSNDFLDILRTIFHNDMGEQHHLENIKLVENEAFAKTEISEDEDPDNDFFTKNIVTKIHFKNIFFKNYYNLNTAFAAVFYYRKNIAQSEKRHFYFHQTSCAPITFLRAMCLRGPPVQCRMV
jgi:desulfoferrodoxin (superoxide reductase-like protein)